MTCDLDYPYQGDAGRQGVLYQQLKALDGHLQQVKKLANAPETQPSPPETQPSPKGGTFGTQNVVQWMALLR